MKISIFTENRAERGLLEPVYDALLQEGLEPVWENVLGASFMAGANYLTASDYSNFAIVPCDRQTMVGVALALFYNNKPFAQVHAGDSGSDSHDEVGRWIISRCASIHFCNSPESAQNIIKSGEEFWRVHLVGSTAFDNIELDQSLVPKEGFDLLLVHPDTYDETQTSTDITRALNSTKPDRLTIAIGPNHDHHWQTVDRILRQWKARRWPDGLVPFAPEFSPRFVYYPDGLPRPQFLALMQHCQRFITNSSSALYELPYFDVTKWVNIGHRNANRKPLRTVEPGGSKRIAQIIKNLDLKDPRLLRKQFHVS